MEGFKQQNIRFYNDDFQLHISRQGVNGDAIISPFHWHECIEILYCEEGTIQVTVDNTEYHMQSKDMILIGPNVVHTTFKEKQTTGSLYNILFDTSLVRSVGSSSLENKCMNSFLNYISSYTHYYIECKDVPKGVDELMQKMEKSFYATGEFHCIYVRAYLLELIAKFCEHGFFSPEAWELNNQTAKAIHKTVEYIEQHCDEKITLSDMAERANLSYHYYSKLFKRVTGKSFAVYLASARVFMAEKLMLEGKYSLQEIAGKVGLLPQTNFNHTYKRLRGYSPNEFLKRIR